MRTGGEEKAGGGRMFARAGHASYRSSVTMASMYTEVLPQQEITDAMSLLGDPVRRAEGPFSERLVP